MGSCDNFCGVPKNFDAIQRDDVDIVLHNHNIRADMGICPYKFFELGNRKDSKKSLRFFKEKNGEKPRKNG